MIKSADELLRRLVENGGAIVSSNSCSTLEIADARARGDFYVDEGSLGYVLRTRAWLDKVHLRDGYMQPPSGADAKSDAKPSIQDAVDKKFFGCGAAIRREEDPPIPGEPYVSLAYAKELACELLREREP
jgi:hypothetical protein